MKSKILKNDFTKLNNFLNALSDKHVVKVGILADKTVRPTQDTVTNADLGAIHEFGSPSKNIPARSWLRMPLMVKSTYIIKTASKEMLSLLANGDMLSVLKDLGFACEQAIDWAFFSSGFGTWAKNKPGTIKAKGSSRPLIDHSFFRRSVVSKVDNRT